MKSLEVEVVDIRPGDIIPWTMPDGSEVELPVKRVSQKDEPLRTIFFKDGLKTTVGKNVVYTVLRPETKDPNTEGVSYEVRHDTDIVFGKDYIQIVYISEYDDYYEAAFWNENEFKESVEAVFAALKAVMKACQLGALSLDDEEIIKEKRLKVEDYQFNSSKDRDFKKE